MGPPSPTTRNTEARADGEQFHTRTVDVRPLTVQTGATDRPWQVPAALAALTLFLTQEQRISVSGGKGGAFDVRLLDNDQGPVVFRRGEQTVRARLLSGGTIVEVVRIDQLDDNHFRQFGTYLHKAIAVPVRRFNVSVTEMITLRTGPAATDPAVAGPVAAGATVSALLPVTTSVLPTVSYVGALAGPPPVPVVRGPIAAGGPVAVCRHSAGPGPHTGFGRAPVQTRLSPIRLPRAQR